MEPAAPTSLHRLEDIDGAPDPETSDSAPGPETDDDRARGAGGLDDVTAGLGPAVSTEKVCRVVGSRVRELRQSLNMTMSAFAAGAGISLGMLSKIEHGQSAPSLSTLVRLAATARVPVTALFRGLDEEHDLVIVRAGEGIERESVGPLQVSSGFL